MSGGRGMLVAALVGLGAGGLTACGGSPPHLDRVRLEQAIRSAVLRDRHLLSTVSCPSDSPVKRDFVFFCEATILTKSPATANGNHQTTFQVTETNDSGGVRFIGL